MKLYDICKEIAQIGEKLYTGEIDYELGRLTRPTKSNHPCGILNEILSIIGWDVYAGKTPTKEKIQETIDALEEFQTVLCVDLSKQIQNLKEHLIEEK